MSQKVTIEVLSNLETNLTTLASEKKIYREYMIVNLLSQLEESKIDPITPLLGTLTSQIKDIGENHDHYKP